MILDMKLPMEHKAAVKDNASSMSGLASKEHWEYPNNPLALRVPKMQGHGSRTKGSHQSAPLPTLMETS